MSEDKFEVTVRRITAPKPDMIVPVIIFVCVAGSAGAAAIGFLLEILNPRVGVPAASLAGFLSASVVGLVGTFLCRVKKGSDGHFFWGAVFVLMSIGGFYSVFGGTPL